MPGGADALVHLRMSLEEAAKKDPDYPLVVLDLDLKNVFPSVEWDSVREAVAVFAPELSSWIKWLYESEAPVYMPDGNVHLEDRGAEQGDILGPAYCLSPIHI